MKINKLKLDLDALEIASYKMPPPEKDASGTVVANSDPVTVAVVTGVRLIAWTATFFD